MQRRMFLKGAGIVTVVAGGGAVWRAYDQGVFTIATGAAYEPWGNWRDTPADGALELVRAAILAASPHNTQPWLFRVTDSSIELHLDPHRSVGALDPYLREEHIGMGCALENIMLAAPANGYAPTATVLPGNLFPIRLEAKMELVARVDLLPRQREESALYNAIPHRHTNRSPYDPHKPLPLDFLAALRHLTADIPDTKLFLFTDESDRKKVVDLSSSANDEIYSDSAVRQGSDRWVRTNWRSMQNQRDGLSVDAFGLSRAETAAAKIMPKQLLLWVASHTSKDAYSDLMLRAPLIGFIAVRNRYDRVQCLQAGRTWQRAHLFAITRGIAGRPCNECVEIVDHDRASGKLPSHADQLNQITGDPAWQPTFVFYMGYPTLSAVASPRRPVQAVLL